MEIGNQIKALRLRRGITQEAMAQHFGISPQAISKWERGVTTPDIAILPELSAYFGVTIDELFSMSDDIRMERIQNMLWDIRFLNPADVENERQFLLKKANREPNNPNPHCMLAQLELHLAQEHRERAREYTLEIIRRSPQKPYVGFMYLSESMNGTHYDPRFNLRNDLISIYKSHLAQYPDCIDAYQWIIGQLIADHRFNEANCYCEQMSHYTNSYSLTVEKIKLALAQQDISQAQAMWTQMGIDYPDNSTVWQWIGDFQTQVGLYADAKKSYQKSIDLLVPPRYLDPVCALALCCEIDGDIDGAIQARQLELNIAETDWNDRSGESIDEIHREISRLNKLKE